MPTKRRVQTTWDVFTYDVWGNAVDGYDVNDRFRYASDLPILLTIETFNPGTDRAFDAASPSDWKLRQIFGVSCAIDTDGDDLTIYVNRTRDGYPIGELHCTSHASLSPIRKA